MIPPFLSQLGGWEAGSTLKLLIQRTTCGSHAPEMQHTNFFKAILKVANFNIIKQNNVI